MFDMNPNIPFELQKKRYSDSVAGGPLERYLIKPLSTNPTKWSNTLKQIVGKMLSNYLSVLNHFVNLALNGLNMCKSCGFLYILQTRMKNKSS